MNIESQSGKVTPSAFQVSMAEKIGAVGEFQKKAFEYLILFLVLSIVYSIYLSSSLDRTSCPNQPSIVYFDLSLLLPVLKFLLITGWPCAVLAAVDATWRGKDSAYVSLFTYATDNVFWIHHYGGGYCIYCVIFGLVAYTFSAGIGHGMGVAHRSISLPGKNLFLVAGLLAFIVALVFDHRRAHQSQAFPIVTATGKSAPSVTPAQVRVPVVEATPGADYSATAQKIAETPHFWQLDPRGGFLNGGRDYCGPVAVSDSLVYLGRHGFPDLLPGSEGDQAQIDMINQLASTHYLGTDPNAGTDPGSVLRGIEKYVVRHGYQCTTMEYKGWDRFRNSEEEFVTADRPDLAWIKGGILDPHGAVWLIVGWYAQTADSQWKRTGGHWVTVVGFDASHPNILLIHNPGTRGNGDQPDDPAQDVIYLKPVAAGTLITGHGPDLDASGRYQINGSALPMGRDTVAFLDAAIVMVVNKL